MTLVHTLLFLLRENAYESDLAMAEQCLKSLEKSEFKTVIVYNQGFLDNAQLKDYLKRFNLNCIVIGGGENAGIVAGRQACFEYIWANFPETLFISELHLDMIFTHNWEVPLIEYLNGHDEPMISCGITDKDGTLYFMGKKTAPIPENAGEADKFLFDLRQNVVVHGFTHPCIHRAEILKKVGGYDTNFLIGKQAFEDDSLLLGYHFYYGTRVNWRPKICCRSVVYHKIAGQRLEINDNIMYNFHGLIRQYGAVGIKRLAMIHQSPWHVRFFSEQYQHLSKRV